MKKLILIICFLLSIINCAISQNTNEALYLEALEVVLMEQVFNLNKVDTIFEGDTSIFYSRSDNFVDNTEKRFEFTHENYLVRVWPSDHIFFFNIMNYIKINNFQVSNDIIILNLELFYNKRSIENINIILGKKRESWRIKKKNVMPTATKL